MCACACVRARVSVFVRVFRCARQIVRLCSCVRAPRCAAQMDRTLAVVRGAAFAPDAAARIRPSDMAKLCERGLRLAADVRAVAGAEVRRAGCAIAACHTCVST